MIKRFVEDTKIVFKMIKSNTKKKFARYLLYIILVLAIPILFIIDMITGILGIEPKKWKVLAI